MRVLQPDGHIDLLAIEAVTRSAEEHVAEELAAEAELTSRAVSAGILHALVTAGVLTPKG